MSDFRPELHVAQQSRRDKLRFQMIDEYHHCDLEQFSDRNLRYGGNVAYEPCVFSSEMINLTKNSRVVPQPQHQKDHVMVVRHHGSPTCWFSNKLVVGAADSSSSGNLSRPVSHYNMSHSQENCDWAVNYTSQLVGTESNQNPVLVGDDISAASHSAYVKPSYCGYQDVQSSFTNNPSSGIISSQNNPKHHGDIHCNSSPPMYPNHALQENVVSSNRETGHVAWADGGNELLSAFGGEQSTTLHMSDSSGHMMNRSIEGYQEWRAEFEFQANKNTCGDMGRATTNDTATNTQGLCLSLSSVPPSRTNIDQYGERSSGSEYIDNSVSDSKASRADYLNARSYVDCKVVGNTRQEIVGPPALAYRNTGPLGPFTGYASILKSSKFLRPAQQLLDEFCDASGSKHLRMCRLSGKNSDSAVGASDEPVVVTKPGDSGASSSTFYSSNGISDRIGGGNCSTESYHPGYQQKAAKLLYMQEEVCRRYKQYHQQTEMVASSFETVAGLSAATPYISLALATISRHFRSLRNAISDKLNCMRKSLGEELSSPHNAISASSKGNINNTPKVKFFDQSFQKHKSGGSNLSFFGPQQHIWRPQRGLPEHAVAILRAWLFDHFLHPYPTDADKHLLASQTGLSRNQVSNWFINARVRVWKPMVEEIHMLETRGVAEANSSGGKMEQAFARPNDPQSEDKPCVAATSEKQMNYAEIGSSGGVGLSSEMWCQEKRSRMEFLIPGNVDGSLAAGFVPCHQRNGLEIGGLGAVTLTLGLRQSAEAAQQQQQHLQQQEHELRRHFGGQMIHEFVG